MKDLVQIDIETALVLYSKGYKHIPIMQGDPFSTDWTSKQPLYLDDLLEGLVIFASDRKRAELLNPPKTDIAKVKEEIAMTYEPHFRADPEEDEDDYEDDDPDWVETEPERVESIPDDDEVPEREKVLTVEQVTKMSEKPDKPPKWNILRVNKLSNEGWTNKQLAEEYGVTEQVVKERLMHYRMKS